MSYVLINLANNVDLGSILSPANDQTDVSHLGRDTTLPKGIVMTYFELGPGAETVLHKTVSLDFTI